MNQITLSFIHFGKACIRKCWISCRNHISSAYLRFSSYFSSGDQSRGTPSGTPPTAKRKKANVHVHITTPSPTNVPESEEMYIKRTRTRRAGSMDKHLLRMGSSYSKRNRSATMSLAIKAIGDSLVTPLDLNISPPIFSEADLEYGKSKKNMFRFPSMKKEIEISRSHSWIRPILRRIIGNKILGSKS